MLLYLVVVPDVAMYTNFSPGHKISSMQVTRSVLEGLGESCTRSGTHLFNMQTAVPTTAGSILFLRIPMTEDHVAFNHCLALSISFTRFNPMHDPLCLDVLTRRI